jgi:hypothetical protein
LSGNNSKQLKVFAQSALSVGSSIVIQQKPAQLPLRIMSIIGITTTDAPEGAFGRFP